MAISFVACSDASFKGSDAVGRKGGSRPPTSTNGGSPNVPSTNDGNDPNSIKVRYGNAVKPTVADYLFVLDNSVSMSNDALRVSQGLASIPKETFPESTRLAVMTTMAAQDPLAGVLSAHFDIKGYGACTNKEPGFLSFVDKASVAAFRACPGPHSAKYPIDACEKGWFAPFEENERGQRCFSAALQNPFHPVGCEAGILAVEQLIKRNSGKPLFRENSAVNIVFISDEQDGCSAALTRGNPGDVAGTADRITSDIKANSKVASVKFHGIVPPDNQVPKTSLSYEKIIRHVNGQMFDISSPLANYNTMITKIIEDKVNGLQPHFFVPASARKITRVEVDGVATNNFTFDASSSKVIVNGLDSSKVVEIVIRFE